MRDFIKNDNRDNYKEYFLSEMLKALQLFPDQAETVKTVRYCYCSEIH
jgi:hypothetical protein